METPWIIRRVAPSDADQVAAHGCFREDDAERRLAYAAWVKPRIGSGSYLGWFAVDDGIVVGGAGVVLLDEDARELYRSLGFTEYAAEMRTRLLDAPASSVC